jgi:hypothetical protein
VRHVEKIDARIVSRFDQGLALLAAKAGKDVTGLWKSSLKPRELPFGRYSCPPSAMRDNRTPLLPT